MGTPTPPQGGTIDVKPSDLHRVAGAFAGQQTPFDKAAKDLVTALEKYPDAGGYGTAAQAFATAYVEVGNRYLEVWARSVVSVGGAAVGFATTANNYSRAEAANDASGKTPAQVQAPPVVIDKAPDYGPVPDLKWGDDDGGDDFIRSLLEYVPDVVWHILRPLLEHAFRWGKVAEVYPFPQQHYLNSLSQSWADMTMSLSLTESTLTGQVSGITQQSNSEWYDAMRRFCSSLWGTTAWGKHTGGYEWGHDSSAAQTATHPVMTVLFDSAMKISDRLRDFAEAAVELNHDVWEIYSKAVKQAVGDLDLSHLDVGDLKEGAKAVGRFFKGLAKGAVELGAEITLNIDTAALNAVVEKYNNRVDALTPQLRALKGDIDEAYRQAPTYAAEEARAEAFGARSLNEFKKEHKYTKDDDEKNHFYPLDLANDEGLYGGHSIDKHVGLSDDQLKGRLRDDSSASSASTFKDLPSAQRYTQAALDDIDNADRIEKWIERVERRKRNNPGWDPNNSKIQPPVELSFTDVTGSTVSGADYATAGDRAQVNDTHRVRVVLRYRDGLDPPFTVVTSMPVN
ncbi:MULTISPECIES: RNase A-like domain-containing protein [unclassified Streptomyces]|uniref:RNase A-like domain-containing protein n=1 Tax=unclassified Streptomyces TaxID=2593676 RepID=UPI002E3784E1|nr:MULTISPECIES: RNase A-like domain-containing protein [unclassified Streptomyces]